MAEALTAIDERVAFPPTRPLAAICPLCTDAERAESPLPFDGRGVRGLAVPRRHRGMEIACALMTARQRRAPRSTGTWWGDNGPGPFVWGFQW